MLSSTGVELEVHWDRACQRRRQASGALAPLVGNKAQHWCSRARTQQAPTVAGLLRLGTIIYDLPGKLQSFVSYLSSFSDVICTLWACTVLRDGNVSKNVPDDGQNVSR